MKKFIFIIISLSAFLMCKKGIEEDKLFIRGRLFLLDTLTRNSNNIPLAKKRVTLSYNNADSLNFLYSDTTDQDGYFYFNLVAEKDERLYTVRYDDSLAGHYYFAKSDVNRGDDQVALIARLNESRENGFIIRVVDTGNEGIPNTTIRLYNNKVLAEQNDPAGAIETLPTDVYGKVYRLNLPAGIYYLNASKTIDTVNYLRIAKPVQVSKAGFIVDTLLLPKKTKVNTNGFTITVTDTMGGIISGATAYLYASLVIAQTNDPAGALNTLVSDSLGRVSKLNIPAGNYYLNATKKLDSLKLQRIAKVLPIMSNGFITDTIMLRKF